MMGMKSTCVARADPAWQQACDRGLDKTMASDSRTPAYTVTFAHEKATCTGRCNDSV